LFVVLFLHGLCMNSRQLGLRLPQPEFIPGHFGGTLPLRKINVETIWDQRPTTAPEAWSWKPFRIMKYPPGNRSHLPCVSRHYLSRWFFLAPRWDMLVPRRVEVETLFFPTIVILKSLKVGYWLIEKFSPTKKLPKTRSISWKVFVVHTSSNSCAPKNISLRLDTNQFGFNWKKHNTYINSKMTSTTQVVNTLSSIKTNTHTHKNLSKKIGGLMWIVIC